jgi:alcohol dehydrogenase class IV
MALAANWAGIAFAETMCHVGHALADGLSIAFHTPHGYNCALALPVALEYAEPAVPKEIKMVAEAMRIPLTGSESAEEVGRLCAEKLWDLMHKLEIKPLKDMGYTREQVLQIAEEGSGSHLSTYCPVPVTREAALMLAGRMYDMYQ